MTTRDDTTPAAAAEYPAGCPAERFDTLPDAQAALTARRVRAALSGSPQTEHRRAYTCEHCDGAHHVRVTTPEGAAA